MSKSMKNVILVLLGIILSVSGIYLVKRNINIEGIMRAFPYICIGIGCGLFGQGMGDFISKKAIQANPSIEKQLEIERNDERNKAISNKAKAKSYDIMTFVFGALMIAFALMGVDMAAILILVFAYLFVQGSGIYYHNKFSKEM